MAIQYSNAVNDARLATIETTIGASPTLAIFEGTIPENTEAANAGTVIATITLPADWLDVANNAQVAKLGDWYTATADATGLAQYFRIFDGANCHMQGNCGVTGFGSDIEFDTIEVTAGEAVNVAAFVIIAGNQ